MPAAAALHRPSTEMSDLQRELGHALDAGIAAAARPATPPPAQADAAPAPQMWGLHDPPASSSGSLHNPITSPLQLLSKLADDTQRLQTGLENLLTEITGELPPQRRLRAAPAKRMGLLPAIAQVATDIEQSHRDLARLIGHIRRQVQP